MTGIVGAKNLIFSSQRSLYKNSLLSYYGQSTRTSALSTDSVWRIWREYKVGNETITEYLDDGEFTQQWSNVENLFPSAPFTNSYALNLNGSTQDANGGDIHNYDIAQAFSFCMWVNPNNLAATRILLAKAASNANVSGYMFRHNATTGALYAQMRCGTNRNATFDISLTAGEYQFICFTYAGSANISGLNAYRNAVKASTPSSGTLSGTMLVGQDFTLGQRNNGFYFSGLIDEVTVWNKELTQADISELYNGGVPNDPRNHTSAANLVSYYPIIDDGLGSPDMVDIVNGLNLTSNGTLSASVP